MKKAIEYLCFALVFLLMLAAVLTYLAPHYNWRVDAVASGSMEPYLKVGSLAVTRPVSPEEIAVGDIITFEPASGETLITHRVISVEEGSLLNFITKGDANGKPDPVTIPAQNVAGKICFHLPFMGYVTEFLKTPWGFVLSLIIPAVIIIAMYIWSIWQTLGKRKTTSVEDG